MVRVVFLLFITINILFANPYKNTCVSCHKDIPVSLEKMFFNYLLKYSSESKVKQNLKEYLLKPKKEKSVMSEAFIDRFGIKKSVDLKEDDLNKAIDIYWDKYKVFGKLK